jgi:hypothetical protein
MNNMTEKTRNELQVRNKNHVTAVSQIREKLNVAKQGPFRMLEERFAVTSLIEEIDSILMDNDLEPSRD